MVGSANGRYILLRGLCLASPPSLVIAIADLGTSFRIYDWLPIALHKLLRRPSRLALRFSVNGVSEKMLNTRGDTEDGIWEVDGEVKM